MDSAGRHRVLLRHALASKGYREGHRWTANRIVELLWRWSDEGALPAVIDASSCTHAVLDEIPSALTDFVKARKFYDYKEHSRVGAKHGEFVTDEICDRFCVLGNAEQATAKLKELEAIGVDQFNIYLMTHGQEDDLAAYGRDIIPSF